MLAELFGRGKNTQTDTDCWTSAAQKITGQKHTNDRDNNVIQV